MFSPSKGGSSPDLASLFMNNRANQAAPMQEITAPPPPPSFSGGMGSPMGGGMGGGMSGGSGGPPVSRMPPVMGSMAPRPSLSIPPPFTPAPPPQNTTQETFLNREPPPPGPIYDPWMARSEPWNTAYTSRRPQPAEQPKPPVAPPAPPQPSQAQLMAKRMNEEAMRRRMVEGR